MIARHDLAHSKKWRGLLVPALGTIRRLITVQAVLAVKRSAQPDLHSLPVRDHEDVAGTGQGQGHMQCQTGGGRTEEDVLVTRHHDKAADGDGRVDQLAEDAVPHLPAQYAPSRPQGDQAAGDGVDQFKAHRFCLPRTSDG